MGSVLIVATLDTKGPEVAYLRDRVQDLGHATLVIDSGILGEPVGIVPDISHAEVAERGGMSLIQVQQAGSRGRAVAMMRDLVTRLVTDLFAEGRIDGGISVGGVGSVIGAAAIQALPVGVPKIVVAPTASGRHEFGPYVGTKDVTVVHSVVDILGLNPVSMTVFDNVAAAMAGMLAHGHRLPPPGPGRKYVGATMLGNTTTAVGAVKKRLAEQGYETVVFHSSGVGGPSMEDLAEAGQFVGVVDYTTNEITDQLTNGIHDGGPERLRRIGRLGLPQVVLPGCIDFSVFTPATIPERLRDRNIYDHNPEYSLVQMTHAEKARLGQIFAERLNEATGPVHIIMPMGGLSIPSVPDGPFWDPEGDANFLSAVRERLRPDIPIETTDHHINDPELGELAADRFISISSRRNDG